jgi:hypothetical protein
LQRVQGERTVKGDDTILIEVGLVDKVLQLLGAGVQAKLSHDLAELGSRDVAWDSHVSIKFRGTDDG